MARATLEATLAALRGAPTLADVRAALRGQIGVVVAAACKRVVADGLPLLDELAPAFDRLCEKPVQRDPGCRGKLAVLEALYELDRWDEVFERAARYRQPEPGGGASDSAAGVRGLCALAYAHFARPDALDVLAELLADRERGTRAAAAQALGNAGRPDATAVLRFKLLTGDEEPAVLAACCEALLALGQADAVPFVARLLHGAADVAEAAALALGGSRMPEAYAPLAAWTARALPEPRRRVGYLALALLRRETATVELLAIVADGERDDALAAGRALATFKDDPSLRERLAAAAAAQPDRHTRAQLAALT